MCDNERLRQLEKLKEILPYDAMGDYSSLLDDGLKESDREGVDDDGD